MKNGFYYETPVGKVGITEKDGKITNLFFKHTVHPKSFEIKETEPLKEAYRQIGEYFDKKRFIFDLPLEPEGTPFELDVWQAMLSIPYGEIRTYKQIAVQIKKPTAYGAVGRVSALNPIALIIPCHRGVGSKGEHAGNTGGFESRKMLLEFEIGGM